MKEFRDRLELLQAGVLQHNAVCAEVGVNIGTFSKMILEHTNPKELHLIDVWAQIGSGGSSSAPDQENLGRLCAVSAMFQPAIKEGRVVIHQGLSTRVLGGFSDGYFDWIYIDADHSYKGCLGDLLAADRKVRIGGRMSGHDYGSRYPGVLQAVNEFCHTYCWVMSAITRVGPRVEPDRDGRGIPSYILERV